MTALLGTFVSIKTMADGSPRLTLDMQCTLADIAAMGLQPGVPFAIARMTKEASVAATQEAEKPKGGALARLAGMWCSDPKFWEFCAERFNHVYPCRSADEAASLIRALCGVESRAELDSNEAAAQWFQEHIRLPFMAWMEGRNT